MSLILTPLERATNSLDEALQITKSPIVRDGTIQRFEFTYELAWKMMRRQLIEDQGSSDVVGLSKKELFAMAVDAKLIDSIELWMSFHRTRNESSHLYDEAKSDAAYQVAIAFLPEVRKLIERLAAR